MRNQRPVEATTQDHLYDEICVMSIYVPVYLDCGEPHDLAPLPGMHHPTLPVRLCIDAHTHHLHIRHPYLSINQSSFLRVPRSPCLLSLYPSYFYVYVCLCGCTCVADVLCSLWAAVWCIGERPVGILLSPCPSHRVHHWGTLTHLCTEQGDKRRKVRLRGGCNHSGQIRGM